MVQRWIFLQFFRDAAVFKWEEAFMCKSYIKTRQEIITHLQKYGSGLREIPFATQISKASISSPWPDEPCCKHQETDNEDEKASLRKVAEIPTYMEK